MRLEREQQTELASADPQSLTGSAMVEARRRNTVSFHTMFHELVMKSITGEDVEFSTFEGQACLVVNVASY